jgi:hypothetical protein
MSYVILCVQNVGTRTKGRRRYYINMGLKKRYLKEVNTPKKKRPDQIAPI